ncbi:MAG: hypothetical protein NE327_05535, partial [Lentisphaeraceae bacterium]|nr:hypothetical protein [Lentisphaeraceae bacterium]
GYNTFPKVELQYHHLTTKRRNKESQFHLVFEISLNICRNPGIKVMSDRFILRFQVRWTQIQLLIYWLYQPT